MSGRWPLGSEVKRKDLTGGAMLYDASRSGNVTAAWFDAGYWRERGEIEGEAQGRGTAQLIRSGDRRYVLRHYRRGGLVARVMQDRYLWRGEQETRAFREWQLLYHLHRAGLPVPAPVAARYRREGLFYTADLITERLMDSVSLASLLRTRGIPILGWITIGRCLRTFHDLGVCHADLNAHNILLVGDDSVYLLDFDRGRLMKPGLWCDGNLVRLRRSLEKITYQLPPENFSEADWHGLLDGYRQSGGHPGASAAPAAGTPAASNGGPANGTSGTGAASSGAPGSGGAISVSPDPGTQSLSTSGEVAHSTRPSAPAGRVPKARAASPPLTGDLLAGVPLSPQSGTPAPAAAAVPPPPAASAQ
jgi:3-deoxy-D-manno-octulosonic acid kinase